MLSASRTVEVDASPAAVFAFVDEPANHVAVTPGIASVSDVEPLENGGKRLSYTYELLGVSLTGTIETPVYEPDERIVFALSGAVSGRLTWTFEPTDGGTAVTYAAEYDLPGGVFERVTRPVAVRYNERQLETTLENLRARLESKERTE